MNLKNSFLGWWVMRFLENVRNHRDIKLVTTERRRNDLVSEQNYHTATFYTENLFAIEMKKERYSWINLSI